MGVDGVPIKFVVVGILKADAHVGPRPYGGAATDERDINDLGNIAVAVWTACTSRIIAIQYRIWRTPSIEILAGQRDPIVVAVGQRSVQSQCIQGVGGIRRAAITESGIKLLVLVNICAA